MMQFPFSDRAKRIIIVIFLIFYPLGAFALINKHGLAAGMLLGVIPIGMVGSSFGIAAGLVAGAFVILINILLASIILTPAGGGLVLLLDGSVLLNCIILLVIGIISGLSKRVTEQQMTRESELDTREQYLSLLDKLAQSIIKSEDLDTMMKALARDLKELFEADDCFIVQWNDSLQRTVSLHTSATGELAYEVMDISSDRAAITKLVIQEGHPLLVEDATGSPHIDRKIASQFPAKSFLGLPLIHGDIKLGAILIAYNTPRKFSREEISRAEYITNQLAIAVWNTRQDFELKKQLRESDTLNEIAQALSQGERIGLSNLLDLIATSAKELVPGAEQAVIHLLNEDGQYLLPQAVSGVKDPGERRLKMRLGEGVAGQVIAQGETINVLDVSTDSRFIKMDLPTTFRSLMVAPIISGDQKLGTISVHSKTPQAFTDNEKELLSTLGTQAAIAIENAHLLEDTQQALKETNALYQISRGLVSLNSDELLEDVVDLLQKNFGYYHVQVFITEPNTGNFVLQAGSGDVGQRLKADGYHLPAGAGIVGYAAETSAPFFTNNVDQVVFFIRNPYLPETKSELAVPVKIGEKILGILDIQQAPPKAFTPRDLQLVSAVADQLAASLLRAELYKNLQISLQQEKRIRNQLVQSDRLALMGRLLASVSHELNNPLQAIQNALFLLKTEKGLSQQGQQDLGIVLSEAERMAAMIERLRATYRPIQTDDFKPIQINSIIEDVYALVSTHFRHRNVSFEFYPDPNLPSIPGLNDQIRQVILNLFINAAEAIHGNGRLSVTTQYLAENDQVFVSVSDDGAGIDPDILPNIFDAFITNKAQGTGLGLTICYDIIAKHQGRIHAKNNPDNGATFKIWLPARRMEMK